MAINNAKHIVSEIDGVRCTIIESGATLERVAFLSDLLEFNNLEVKEIEIPSETPVENQNIQLVLQISCSILYLQFMKDS